MSEKPQTAKNNEKQQQTELQPIKIPVCLRRLYLMLLDMYDNNYPIPFIEFKEKFDLYMKLTKNNIIDSVILLIYGIYTLEKIGKDEEFIEIIELDEKGKEKPKDPKTLTAAKPKKVLTPFYVFTSQQGKIVIRYDYAYAIPPENFAEIIEEGEDNARKIKPVDEFKIFIDPRKKIMNWAFNNKYFEINAEKHFFKSIQNGAELYEVEPLKLIQTQAAPRGETAVRSYTNDRYVVTELKSGNQFIYHYATSNADLIVREKHTLERIYSIGNDKEENAEQ